MKIKNLFIASTALLTTVPAISMLVSCDDKNKLQITVHDGQYLEDYSYIELNEDSHIMVYPKSGTNVIGINKLIIGGVETTDYTWNQDLYLLFIDSTVMTSKKIEIYAQTEPYVKAKTFYPTFLEYDFEYNGYEITKMPDYVRDVDGQRKLTFTLEGDKTGKSKNISGNLVLSYLNEKEIETTVFSKEVTLEAAKTNTVEVEITDWTNIPWQYYPDDPRSYFPLTAKFVRDGRKLNVATENDTFTTEGFEVTSCSANVEDAYSKNNINITIKNNNAEAKNGNIVIESKTTGDERSYIKRSLFDAIPAGESKDIKISIDNLYKLADTDSINIYFVYGSDISGDNVVFENNVGNDKIYEIERPIHFNKFSNSCYFGGSNRSGADLTFEILLLDQDNNHLFTTDMTIPKDSFLRKCFDLPAGLFARATKVTIQFNPKNNQLKSLQMV